MKEKIILSAALLLLVSQTATADEAYVSPENYAVNEADLIDYLDVPANTSKPERIKKIKSKEYKGEIIHETVLMYKTKEYLQKQKFKHDNPHHGELHEIKVNSKYKNETKKDAD